MKLSIQKALVVASIALLTCTSTAIQSRADTVAYTTSGTETDLGDYGLAGFEFTPSENIDITALGYTGLSLGGDAPHVTLWDASAGLGSLSQIYDTGNILGSVVSAPAGAGLGSPSFVSVGTPIALTAGKTYLITAPAYWAATFTSAGIAITDPSAFSSTQFLADNTGFFANGGWANTGYTFTSLTAAPAGNVPTIANFEFTVVSAPEPSTYAMLGAGLLALTIMVRRRTASVRL